MPPAKPIFKLREIAQKRANLAAVVDDGQSTVGEGQQRENFNALSSALALPKPTGEAAPSRVSSPSPPEGAPSTP
eukprot:13694465-Alexandrium_andersonii.AAC.1